MRTLAVSAFTFLAACATPSIYAELDGQALADAVSAQTVRDADEFDGSLTLRGPRFDDDDAMLYGGANTYGLLSWAASAMLVRQDDYYTPSLRLQYDGGDWIFIDQAHEAGEEIALLEVDRDVRYGGDVREVVVLVPTAAQWERWKERGMRARVAGKTYLVINVPPEYFQGVAASADLPVRGVQ